MHTRNGSSLGRFLFAAISFSLSSPVHSQQADGTESVKLGEAAPDFALLNTEGKRVQLRDYRGTKNVVLVFYPALFRAGG